MRAPDSYQTLWGKTEQPTTLVTSLSSNTFGNWIIANRAGKLVGLRWGRMGNTAVSGCLGFIDSNSGSAYSLLRVCMSPRTVSDGIATLRWVNMFFHPFLPVAIGDRLQIGVCMFGAGLSYNDGALLAADVTIGDWTYPKDAVTLGNGSTRNNMLFFPNAAANGRRFAIDVLWLPNP